MGYNPGISYRGDLHLSRGFQNLGDGLARGMIGRQEESKLNQSAVKTLGFLKKQAENDPTIAELMGDVDMDNLSPRDARALVDGIGRSLSVGSQVKQQSIQDLMGVSEQQRIDRGKHLMDIMGTPAPGGGTWDAQGNIVMPRSSDGNSESEALRINRQLAQDRARTFGGTISKEGQTADSYWAKTYDANGNLRPDATPDPAIEQYLNYLNEAYRATGNDAPFKRAQDKSAASGDESKTVTPELARQLMQEAGGDKEKARALARQRGLRF